MTICMTSWGNGAAGSTAIMQCTGLIEMTNLSDYSCNDVYDAIVPVPNSNDPMSMSTNGRSNHEVRYACFAWDDS